MIKVTVEPSHTFTIASEANGLRVDGAPFAWDVLELNPSTFHILYQDGSYTAEVLEADYANKTFVVRVNGRTYQLRAQDQYDLLLEQMGISAAQSAPINQVKAPMPGLILEVKVAVGDLVKKGDPLIILEAMKMENIIKSPGDGRVKALKAEKGKNVEKNQVLVEF